MWVLFSSMLSAICRFAGWMCEAQKQSSATMYGILHLCGLFCTAKSRPFASGYALHFMSEVLRVCRNSTPCREIKKTSYTLAKNSQIIRKLTAKEHLKEETPCSPDTFLCAFDNSTCHLANHFYFNKAF